MNVSTSFPDIQREKHVPMQPQLRRGACNFEPAAPFSPTIIVPWIYLLAILQRLLCLSVDLTNIVGMWKHWFEPTRAVFLWKPHWFETCNSMFQLALCPLIMQSGMLRYPCIHCFYAVKCWLAENAKLTSMVVFRYSNHCHFQDGIETTCLTAKAFLQQCMHILYPAWEYGECGESLS